MFTGIIEKIGKIVNINQSFQSTQITIQTEIHADALKLGDSIAVNGVCLTIVKINNNQIIADVSPETLKRSTLGMCKLNESVNLELALRISDRLGGHIVTGHIDGMAYIESKVVENNSIIFTFNASSQLMKYIAVKGSIALDGISLTVADCTQSQFKISVIPYTLKHTILINKKSGDVVNVECDVISKYVERLLFYDKNQEDKKDMITNQFLKDNGFF